MCLIKVTCGRGEIVASFFRRAQALASSGQGLPANPRYAWRHGPKSPASREACSGLGAPLHPLVVLRQRGQPTLLALASQGPFSLVLPLRLGGVAGLDSSLPKSLVAGLAAFVYSLGGRKTLKLRFKGKSFKWHRRKGALVLRFGYSHLTALAAPLGVRWRRLGKMKILLFGSNRLDLLRFGQAVVSLQGVNVYHGRGLRLRRQRVLRKVGKVSAYH